MPLLLFLWCVSLTPFVAVVLFTTALRCLGHCTHVTIFPPFAAALRGGGSLLGSVYRSTVLRCAGTTCVVDQRLTLTSLSNSVIPPGACWTLGQRAVLRNSQKTWGGQRMGIGIIDGYPSSFHPTGFQRGSRNNPILPILTLVSYNSLRVSGRVRQVQQCLRWGRKCPPSSL